MTQLIETQMRIGQLGCACPTSFLEEQNDNHRILFAAAYGLAVLAQALVLTLLPEQSRLLAPTITLIGLPFALLLVGAAIATFPATFLLDAFGRRAAFALGASLGAAGGILSAFALIHANFYALCLGAFWLGLAQGFALFYRHIAAQFSTRAGLIVFAGGIGAALAAPALFTLRPNPASTLLIAAGLHIIALALSTRLPHFNQVIQKTSMLFGLSWGYIGATSAGAAAWFIMSAGMLHGPLTLAGCSAPYSTISGVMGGHLIAMYAPSVIAARWPLLFPPLPSLGIGLGLMIFGVARIFSNSTILSISMSLIVIGIGWSITNIGCFQLLYQERRPSRAMLALHDLSLLSAAALGALAFTA
ncbi:MAG: MFS transporter [Methylocystis sp.]